MMENKMRTNLADPDSSSFRVMLSPTMSYQALSSINLAYDSKMKIGGRNCVLVVRVHILALSETSEPSPTHG